MMKVKNISNVSSILLSVQLKNSNFKEMVG